ncbi:MAG: hypothetical protein WB810_16705 [Candidatus Cybelea sp.]
MAPGPVTISLRVAAVGNGTACRRHRARRLFNRLLIVAYGAWTTVTAWYAAKN